MIPGSKRINIFTGHFGSGKTEISLNYVLGMLREYPRTALVDLDILNPYFTSRQARDMLNKYGVEVVTPPQRLAGTDLPIVSPRIRGVLADETCGVVCDVGGDDVGAVVLGQFGPELFEREYDLFLVINPYRPFTRDYKGITTIQGEIEAAAGLKVTALVSNPNLGSETGVAAVKEGHEIVREVARRQQLPIAFVAVRSDLAAKVAPDLDAPVFSLELFLKKPWE